MCKPKKGLAQKSGVDELDLEGGNRNVSLKSTEFSEGGFHLRLETVCKYTENASHI